MGIIQAVHLACLTDSNPKSKLPMKIIQALHSETPSRTAAAAAAAVFGGSSSRSGRSSSSSKKTSEAARIDEPTVDMLD